MPTHSVGLQERVAVLNDRARRRNAARRERQNALVPAPVAAPEAPAPRISYRDAASIEAADPAAFKVAELDEVSEIRAWITMMPHMVYQDAPPCAPVLEERDPQLFSRGAIRLGFRDDDQFVIDRDEPTLDENDAARAALRAHLVQGADYGPEVTRVALIQHTSGATRLAIVFGRLSAIHRMLPDLATQRSWDAAGASQGKRALRPKAMEVFPLRLEA